MKRLLIILMLIAVPFQLSWAAAAVYCEHEMNPKTVHFGHHDHKHQADEGDAGNKEKPVQLHKDCGYCHTALQAALTALPSLVIQAAGSLQIEHHPLSYTSHIPDVPPRPDRQPVA